MPRRSGGLLLGRLRLLLLLGTTVTVAAFLVPHPGTQPTTTTTTLTCQSQRQPQRQPTTALGLFFKSPEGASPRTAPQQARPPLVPENVAQQWRTGDMQFPCTWEVAATTSTATSRRRRRATPLPSGARLTIRPMTWADVPQLVQLCYDEYGSYTSSSSSSSSSSNRLQNWTDKWEDAALRPYVWATLVLKVGLPSTRRLPPDHAILVASLSLPTESRSNNGNHNNGNSDDGSPRSERLVGMAEVSRQPALPDRNPPPWPIPLVLKEAYCRLALGNSNASSNDPNRRTTQGWLTNLLVVPAHRGRGWSKVLVQACEGVARAWGRSSLHLHCHATATTPQALYRSLDYRPPSEEATTSNTKEDSAYAWMNTGAAENVVAPWQSSIYMLEGVPLLYMCKSLVLDAD